MLWESNRLLIGLKYNDFFFIRFFGLFPSRSCAPKVFLNNNYLLTFNVSFPAFIIYIQIYVFSTSWQDYYVSVHTVRLLLLYIQIKGHTAGRNEAQLGKVTAPEWCCLNPEGLTLWSNHSIFTGFPPCMCVLCVHLFADYAAWKWSRGNSAIRPTH